jgi:hypothetical protein
MNRVRHPDRVADLERRSRGRRAYDLFDGVHVSRSWADACL